MTAAAPPDWAVLAYEPFSADRDVDVRLLSDRIGHARKHHTCIICTMPIRPGERIRMRTEIDRDLDMVMTFRFCTFCCEAMALSVTDENDAGRAIEERTAFGMRGCAGICLPALGLPRDDRMSRIRQARPITLSLSPEELAELQTAVWCREDAYRSSRLEAKQDARADDVAYATRRIATLKNLKDRLFRAGRGH